QDKYVAVILRKFGFSEGKLASTLIDAEKPLLKDSDGKLYLGLRYPKDSPFDLVAYSDSDYNGASLDRKSTTRGCQFLGYRLISWQCKKQTVVATSSTESEYVATARGCAQVLWIQNQLLDYDMVAILEKSDATEGFEEIIDFLSRSYIHNALTVNPHLYVSCIKQFWNTALVKRSHDVTRLQALVDRKKIMISKDVIREILQFDDAEGVVCLLNEEIFAGLAQMGYEKLSTKLTFYKAFFSSQWKFLIHTLLQSLSAKRTSWNDFSTAMAYAVICLSTETVAEDVANEAIPSTPTPLILSSPPYHDIPSTSQVQSSPPQQPQKHDKAAQKLEIIKLKGMVKRLERDNKGRMIDDLDKDEGIELVVDQVKDVDTAETEGRHAAE
nr:putative ribonuclease H-like domain-containing protein [Tanacetum cinerariifolium]